MIAPIGILDVNKEKLTALIAIDRTAVPDINPVHHPVLGSVSAFQAGIFDLCFKAYQELTTRLEN